VSAFDAEVFIDRNSSANARGLRGLADSSVRSDSRVERRAWSDKVDGIALCANSEMSLVPTVGIERTRPSRMNMHAAAKHQAFPGARFRIAMSDVIVLRLVQEAANRQDQTCSVIAFGEERPATKLTTVLLGVLGGMNWQCCSTTSS